VKFLEAGGTDLVGSISLQPLLAATLGTAGLQREEQLLASW